MYYSFPNMLTVIFLRERDVHICNNKKKEEIPRIWEPKDNDPDIFKTVVSISTCHRRCFNLKK